METGFSLIHVKLDYGLGDKKKDISVSNCRFINCYTERSDKKLISGTEIHHTLFSDKEKTYDVKCPNCMGLNDVKSGNFVEISIQKDTSVSAGAKLGAGTGTFLTGGIGGVIGAAAGAAITSAKKKNK